jgi:hypothetical protein
MGSQQWLTAHKETQWLSMLVDPFLQSSHAVSGDESVGNALSGLESMGGMGRFRFATRTGPCSMLRSLRREVKPEAQGGDGFAYGRHPELVFIAFTSAGAGAKLVN